MDSVSTLRQRARDEIDQMDEDALRRVMPALSRERRRRAAEMEDDMEERMAAYRMLYDFAKSIPPGTDIDRVVAEEMEKKHGCLA